MDDVAALFNCLFHGNRALPVTMPALTEPPTNVVEWTHVVSCLGIHRTGDNFGHVAELWKDSPDDSPAARSDTSDSHAEMSHPLVKLRFSKCFRKQTQQSRCLIAGLLPIYVWALNGVHASCSDAWKNKLKLRNR